MLLLGLILVLIAAGAVALALFGGGDPASMDLGALGIFETTALWIFLIGGATVLLLVLGLGMVRAGTSRANKRRKEKRDLKTKEKTLAQREEHLEKREATTTHGTATDTATDTDGSHRRDHDVPPA